MIWSEYLNRYKPKSINMSLADLIVLVVIFIFFAASILFGWYFIQQTKLKERILLSEKGIDINNLIPEEKKRSSWWLRIGIVVISASLGLLLGIAIDSSGTFPLITFFLFGGIGMIIAHYVDKPKNNN